MLCKKKEEKSKSSPVCSNLSNIQAVVLSVMNLVNPLDLEELYGPNECWWASKDLVSILSVVSMSKK